MRKDFFTDRLSIGYGGYTIELDGVGTLTAARLLSIDMKDANRNLVLGGDLTLGNSFTTSGNFPVTFTVTGSTTLTLPTSGTLTTTGSNSFTGNQSINVAGSTSSASLVFGGTTNNWIDFGTTGLAAPAYTTRSVGTKIVFNNSLSGTVLDYAVGVESGNLWLSSGGGFKIYTNSATTPTLTLTNAGALSTVSLTLTNALPATSGGTAQNTYATGDLIYASAANTLSKRTIGSTQQALVVSGGVPTWATLDMSYLPDAMFKKSVRAASTGVLTITARTTTTLTVGGTALTWDGVTLANGDRVLLKDGSTGVAGAGSPDNGIYTVGGVGSSIVLTRAVDADTISEIAGAMVGIDQGTVNGGQFYTNVIKTTDTLGTTNIPWYLDYNSSASASTNTANTLVLRDASGNFSAGTITATLSGNATTATTASNANNLNNQPGSFYQNAGNLNAGILLNARLTTTQGAYTIDPTIPVTNAAHSGLGSATIGELALCNMYSENKMLFKPPTTLEYTTDGTTWNPHPSALNSGVVQNAFLGYAAGGNIQIYSPNNGNWTAMRMVFTATSYVYLNHLYVYNSTSGHTCAIQIERSFDTTTWEVVASNSNFSTWPGHTMVPHTTIPFNPTPTQGTHYKYVRVTFTPAWNATYPSNNISIYNVNWYGQYPAVGQPYIYTWDFSKNVTFPANVTATGFVGNASTATKFATARNINGVAFDGSADITIASNTTNALTFNNGGAGAASGTTFNGSAAQTISYNTVGAAPAAGSTSITTLGTVSSGTWNGAVVAGQYGGTGVNNSGKTITLGGNLTTSGAFATTFTMTAATTVTFPTTGTLATTANSETLTNKTMSTGSVWNGGVISGTYGGTGVNNGANTITVGGNVSIANSFTTSGAFALTLTTTAATNVTLPTSGTLAIVSGALGTPTSITLTNATGLPVSTGISGLGAGVATFLATPSSANLAAAVTGETGSGALVFGTSPTLTTPQINAAMVGTSAAVTAGTNAQGQGALTQDYNIITTAANNPSGVTLPTATVGRWVTVINRGANPVSVYPATGGQIDALGANVAISLPVNGVMDFGATSTTQWYSSYNKTIAGSSGGGTTTNTLTFSNGGAGDASGSTFNGSVARTISYNSIGAAPLASPTFTGTPAAPTAAVGTNTTQIATTAFVQSARPNFTISGTAPTSPNPGDMWLYTDNGSIYTYFNDGDSSQWVEFGGDFHNGMTASALSVVNPISTPKDGDIRVTSGVVELYANTAWRQIYPAVYN